MQNQLFEMNIPADLTTGNQTNLKVIVVGERFDTGKLMAVRFLDMSTDVFVKIKDNAALWNMAKEQCDALHECRNNVIDLGPLPKLSDHHSSLVALPS